MIRLGLILSLCLPLQLQAETVVATRTIAPKSILTASDLTIVNEVIPGGHADELLFVGMEARVALYAGRPISVADVSAPAVVERNQIVTLVYMSGALRIATEGRALGRAGPGDVIQVMNLSSRNSINAKIDKNGIAYVGVSP